LLKPEKWRGRTLRIILTGVEFKTSKPLRVYAERRVLSWLGHLERQLDIVTVQLAKERGAEGRRTRCRLLARPAHGASPVVDLIVEEASADVYDAIDRAPERMAMAFDLATRRRPVRAAV
jgi:ribosome-associated translation inhibitor RaiA